MPEKTDRYRVNEIFRSVQGEGIFSGIPSLFIRLQGCNVGCVWCDTKYTWKLGGSWKTLEEIAAEVEDASQAGKHVVITGGEPTLHNLDPLLEMLSGRFTQLETSGQHNLKGTLRPTWVTCSPKSNLKFKIAPNLLPIVDELKFVVDDTFRPGIALDLAAQIPEALVVLMPEGCPPAKHAADRALAWCMEFGWRYSDRLQYRLEVR